MTRHDPDEQTPEEREREIAGTLRAWALSRAPERPREQAPAPRRADPGDQPPARREFRQRHPRPPRGGSR